jgi:mRNA-degrading endonuclease toxin of MazEF toxin-antitoxin module
MNRGSIYWINLEPSNPPEFGNVRPCLVISNSEQNLLIPTVVVIPLSSKAPEIWPLRLKVSMNKKNSYAVIPGIRQVSKKRLQNKIDILSFSEMEKVDDAIKAYLND